MSKTGGELRKSVWGKGGDDYPFYDKLKFAMVLRNVKKVLPKQATRENALVIDVGCGWDARILTGLQDMIAKGIGLDLEVNEELKKNPKFSFRLGDLRDLFPSLESNIADLIVFLSVLEHMENPVDLLREARRILKPGGRVFLCSPTWFGKWVLENVISNRLLDPYGETPKQYDDHKMYYDPKDMWPLLVKAGFVSSEIKLWRSNFGCSTSGYAEKRA